MNLELKQTELPRTSNANTKFIPKRNIKFRAWNNKSKEMLDWFCICQSVFNRGETQLMYDIFTAPSFVDDCGFVLMQFTGLQDSKGNGIYEGDIIKSWYSRDVSGNDIVHTERIVEYEIKEYSGEAGYEILFPERCEIIGNIFQNPELLSTTP